MFDKIYSKVEPEKLLHIVCRPADLNNDRNDIVDENEYLQLAILNFNKGKTFKPHKHIYKTVPKSAIAQESWVVISGKVKVFFAWWFVCFPLCCERCEYRTVVRIVKSYKGYKHYKPIGFEDLTWPRPSFRAKVF